MNARIRSAMVLAFVLGASLYPSACAPKSDEPESVSNNLRPRGAILAEKLSFAELQSEYQDVVQAFPLKEQSQTVIKRLVEAALREQMASDGEALMRQMPGDNVGLYLFENKYSELLATSREAALGFANEVQEEFAGTRLALIAFDKKLLQLRTDDSAAFLKICAENLSGTGTELLNRIPVVLVRRADYLYETGDVKNCAKDYLQLWSAYPDIVSACGMELKVLGRLKDAGLYLESTSLEASAEPAKLAMEYFEEFKGMDTSLPMVSHSLSEMYWQYTPDVDALASIAVQARETTLDGVKLLDRIGSIAMYSGQEEWGRQIYVDCGNRLLELFSAERKVGTDDQELRQYFPVVYQNILRIFSNFHDKESLEVEYRIDKKAELELLIALTRMEYQLAISDDKIRTSRMDADVSAAERFASMATKLNDRDVVVEAFQDIVGRYENESVAPEYLLKIADLYRESWEAPAKAIETYTMIRERYSDSPFAEDAAAKSALAHFDLENYQDAHNVAQEYMVLYPTGRSLVSMKMVSALCESAIGLADEAEAHMLQIAEEHRLSPLAAQALFWVASSKLAIQEYAAAQAGFQDLIERYPESPFSIRAREYLVRLESVPEVSRK